MNADRRTLIKGMVVGGALLRLGVPEWAMAASPPNGRRPVSLLLGGTEVDAAFASGMHEAAHAHRAADVAAQRVRGDDIGLASRFLAEWNGMRLVGVMPDGAYAVFHELARAATVQLLVLGRHACSGDPGSPSRHALLSASATTGIGPALALCLSRAGRPFQVRETMLDRNDEHVIDSVATQADEARRATRPAGHGTDPIADCARLLGVALGCVAFGVVPAGAPPLTAGRDPIAAAAGAAAAYTTFIMDVG